MIGKSSRQIDIFSHIIYDRLIAKDCLPVKINLS
jgi:hypothetical protein